MFEIRNYHFEPTHFEAYKQWAATLALPYLRGKMEVIGFWVTTDLAPEYGGSLPHDAQGSPANVTWIIRWPDKAQRDRAREALRSDPAWQAILAQVPGGRASYLRTEAKFATAL